MSFVSHELTLDDINNFFTIGQTPVPHPMPAAHTTLGGRKIDPVTGGSAEHKVEEYVKPSYKRHNRVNNPQQLEYAREVQTKETDKMFEKFQLLQAGEAPSTCGMSSRASTYSGYMEQPELNSTIGAMSTTLPEGVTEEEAVSVYKNYNFKKEYDTKLPITRFHEEIVDTIESNQVTVIHGSTGSGKTTQVAQYILDHHAQSGLYCNIIVTQPRRIAAISVAKRVCDERDWRLGSICGYQVGLDRCTDEDTRLTYCTTGVLLEMLVNKGNMRDFTHVILDEVHERDQDSDFCLLLVRMLLRHNSREVKVVLMSATAESEKFAAYFALPIRDVLEPAPIFNVSGRAYEIQEYYLEDLKALGPLPELKEDKPEISAEALDIAVQLIIRFDTIEAMQKSFGTVERGSVLVFLPGLQQITELDDRLKQKGLSDEYKLWVLPLHSSVTSTEQRRVFDRPQPGVRKVILSTNIAESSITVSDVKYVIDFCLTKNLVCDVETNFTSLQVQWAAKSNCIQRMGRAGRVSDGRVYRFVTRRFYKEKLPDHGTPEMQRCPLDFLVLKAKLLNMGEPLAILGRALDPPLLDDIERTVLGLKEVGALSVKMRGQINPHNGDMLFMGRIMAKLPVSIHLTKLMLLGHVFGLLRDTIIIAACLSNKSFFSTPYRANFMAYRKRLEWANFSSSDLIAYLNAYKTWEVKKQNHAFDNNRVEEDWCRKHFIQFKRIRDVEELAGELQKRLKREGIEAPFLPRGRVIGNALNVDERELLLKLLFCGAFYPHYFVQHKQDEVEANKQMSGHSHTNTVMVGGLPPNQGALYRKDVEQMFRNCIDGDTPVKAHFEESKAFIELPREHAQEKGRVVTGVYMALKMRQLRIGLTLNMMDHRTALQRVEQLHADAPFTFGVDADEGYESSQQVRGEAEYYSHVTPPSANDISVFQIIVPYVITCGHFWAHMGDDNTAQQLSQLQTQINQYGGRNLTSLLDVRVKTGAYCLAPYFSDVGGDDCYYRARITNVIRINKQKQVEVFFLDYGNTEKMLSTCLMELDKSLCSLPFQAFECELAHIKPSPLRCPTGNWSDSAKQRFFYLVNDVSGLYAQIYSIVHGVWRVVLTQSSPNVIRTAEPISINELLVRENFADKAEENFLSKKSHKERQEAPLSTLTGCSVPGEFGDIGPPSSARKGPSSRLGEVAARRLPTRDDLNKNRSIQNMRGNQVRLTGPWSAYEMRFHGLTMVGSFREAKIERDSVNSVCVDDDPADLHDRMMVAAIVGLNASTESIIVRDTTVMPKIPGLLGIMALTFCPFAELRCDRAKTRYTGVLCGLGTDPYSGDPAFPDHDMEIDFDFQFTEEDLGMVNAVRMGIHVAIGSELTTNDWGPEAILKVQQKTREKLLKLITRRREYVEKCVSRRRYRWNLIDPDDVKHPVTKESVAEEDMPISLHCGIVFETPEIKEDDETRRKLLKFKEHIDFLHDQSEKSLQVEVRCALCDRTVRNSAELRLHLRTMAHKSIERQIMQELGPPK